MYKQTNPILEVIQDADRLLANTYHKIAVALAKKGKLGASKDYFKKWSDALKHLKATRKEIENNATDAEQSLANWRPGEPFIDGSYLGFAEPIEDSRRGQDQQSRDRGSDSQGVPSLLPQ